MERNIVGLLGSVWFLLRYRFFLFAGIFPYFLGQAIAFKVKGYLNWQYFWWGLLGIFLVLTGVELFNEYFDSKDGGDRIFALEKPAIPKHFFFLGLLVFGCAFLIGLYLSIKTGWPIIGFSFLGFLAAYFYVGPPFRWAYRGLGELVIAFSYGPLMVLGSYYLQARAFSFIPFFASLICALTLFSLAILNEIPDYIQDKLVGKRNIVVRFGQQRAIKIFKFNMLFVFVLLSLGIFFRIIPVLSIVVFLGFPWIFKGVILAEKNYQDPKRFISIINANVAIYLVIMISLGVGYACRL